MYRPSPSGGQGPPAPFVPASQQTPPLGRAVAQRSRAIPILPPSSNASPETKAAFARQVAGNASPSVGNGTLINATSPAKAALSAKAASAAVFVPKVAATSAGSGSTDQEYEEQDAPPPTRQMQNFSLNGHDAAPAQQQGLHYNPYIGGTDSGRGTPTSFGAGVGGYDTDGSNNMFDPTYMGPLPSSQQQAQQDGQHAPQQQTHATPSMGSAVQQRGAAAPPTGRAYNPYEHLNEFGEPTAAGAGLGGIAASGQMGLDYYSGATSHSAAAAAAVKLRQPLQYHLYNPPMPHVSNLHPQHLSANAFFMSSDEREELQRKNEAMLAGVPPIELGGPKLPEELHVYHSLVPLEPSPLPGMPGNSIVPQLIDPRIVPPTAPGTVNHLTGACGEASRVFGYCCHVYKAQCTLDGKYYVLRRLENFRLTHEAAISLVERWRRIRHPSIVSVREAFTTRAFGDSSIVFVYDYHPLATTLYAEHMVPKPPQPDRRTGRLQAKPMQISERTLWSYLCQLTNVVRLIHQHGLAARCIEPSKVLRTGQNRIRLNCCAIFDVIAYDPNASPSAIQEQQAEDLVNMGKLFLSLACNSISAVQSVQRSLDQITRVYSPDFKAVVTWLLAPAGEVPMPSLTGSKAASEAKDDLNDGASSPSSASAKTADALQRLLGVKYSEEFDSTLNQSDLLESGLSKELENARLVRLLCKFGFINERPEFDHDPRWSETGDRYIVKLFRDHVFHAVDVAGRPVVDLTHILTNLNKLDAGSLEKIMLTSRDEQSCLVVSYREIKTCIDAAFADLSRAR